MWRKAVFSTVRRALDHRVTVCVQSAASGNSNRFPSVLEHDVESRESFVFASRKVGASPVDFRCKIECVAPADSGLVALLQYIPCIRVKSKSKERQRSTLAIGE
jgi:hypothetical protein